MKSESESEGSHSDSEPDFSPSDSSSATFLRALRVLAAAGFGLGSGLARFERRLPPEFASGPSRALAPLRGLWDFISALTLTLPRLFSFLRCSYMEIAGRPASAISSLYTFAIDGTRRVFFVAGGDEGAKPASGSSRSVSHKTGKSGAEPFFAAGRPAADASFTFLMRRVRMAFSFATFRFTSRFSSLSVRFAIGPQKYFRCGIRDRGRNILPQNLHCTLAFCSTFRYSCSMTWYVVRTTS